MNFEDIKKGKKYVVKKEWRDIKDDEFAKYVEATEDSQEWPYDWPEFKWLNSGEIDHLPVNCIEREANLKEDENYLIVLAI